eukprot:3723854-Rhodomonas_salina.1
MSTWGQVGASPTRVSAGGERGAHRFRLQASCAMQASYAMSGTDIAHGGIGVRARYAVPGTDMPYRGSACGTELAYGGTTFVRDV